MPLTMTDDAVRLLFQSDADESVEIISNYFPQAMALDDGMPDLMIVDEMAKKSKVKEVKKVCFLPPRFSLASLNSFPR
jgi:hypothetical protein